IHVSLSPALEATQSLLIGQDRCISAPVFPMTHFYGGMSKPCNRFRNEQKLGPLNPGWFEELTARACTNEGIYVASNSEEEETVKVPETSALDSQLFSTPKIFKQKRCLSLDSIHNEESPCEAECAPPTSGLKDKDAIFVRKLFPSLSMGFARTATLTDQATLYQDGVPKSALCQNEELEEKSVCFPTASLSSGLWMQRVPSAIEDGEVRSTVQNVLDGAEDVLSIFFSNSTSTLRRIKTKERIRRRIISSSEDVTTTSEPEKKLKADVETKSPSNTDNAFQWTPLSLSESALNEGYSGVSVKSNHSSVSCSENNNETLFICSGGLQSYPDATHCQRTLLDKSPAFMFNRKPRKFVYQVPNSNKLRTVAMKKAPLSACLDPLLKEDPQSRTLCSVLSYSSVNATTNRTQSQALERITTDSLYSDPVLDMTQLSKAFAVDFTQETKSIHNDVSARTDQIQPRKKHEEKPNDYDPDDYHSLPSISQNKSTVVLETFDISHDSGCPTTITDLDSTTASCAKITFCPSFKTAGNKAISIPHEAVLNAKASLDEAAEDFVTKTLNPSFSGNTNAQRSVVGPCYASGKTVCEIQKCSKMSVSSLSKESGNEVCSTKNIVLLEADCSHQKVDFERTAERPFLSINNSANKPSVVVSTTYEQEENGALTASQKADVTELCSILEEANTQCEFTQFRTTNRVPDNHSKERDWDPDLLDDINFDDSFNCNTTSGKLVKIETTSGSHFDWIDADRCSISPNQTGQGFVSLLLTEQSSVIGEMKNSRCKDNKDSQFQRFGFQTANGKPIRISENSLSKAKYFFEDDSKDDPVEGEPNHTETEPLLNTLDPTSTKNNIFVQKKQDVNFSCGKATQKVMNKQVAGNARTIKSYLREKADVAFVDSNIHLGFSTAKGVKLKVSENALLEARNTFKDVECLEESQIPKLDLPSFGNPHVYVSTDGLQNAKDVYLCETPSRICQPDSVMLNQTSCGPDIPPFNSAKNFQEASSGTEEVCSKNLPSEPSLLQSLQSNCFQTACEKGVSVSNGALKKAKAIFKDCDSKFNCLESTNIEGTAEIVKQPIGLIPKNKIVSLSDVQEFNAAFRSSHFMNESEQIHLQGEQKTLQREFQKNPSEAHPLNGGCGFSTASGKVVSISAEALERAKAVLVDSVGGSSCINLCQNEHPFIDIQTCDALMVKLEGFSPKVCENTVVSTPSEQEKVNDFFEESDDGTIKRKNHGLNSGFKKPISNITFSHKPGPGHSSGKRLGLSTGGEKTVAFSPAAMQKAKRLFENCDGPLTSGSLQHKRCKGITTAQFKNSTISEEAVRAAVPGCSESSVNYDPKVSLGNNGGFSTAGGKKVTISATALHGAKRLFEDCEDDCSTSGSLQPKSYKGFTTTQGKNVTDSEEAVRATFPGFSEVSIHYDSKISLGNNVGFSTAGGKKVTISATALHSAKRLFEDCEDDCSTSGSLQHKSYKGFTTTQGKNVTVSEEPRAKTLFKDCDEKKVEKAQHYTNCENLVVGNPNEKGGDSTYQRLHSDVSKPSAQHLDRQIKTTDPWPLKAAQSELAELDLHSSELNNCTETQQIYFEQEAIDCTKALLADDDLNESARLMSEDTECQKHSFPQDLQTEQNHNRKRKFQLGANSVADPSPPPLKRQLLSEFDRTLATTIPSRQPLKSCPNGTLKDRCVFKYHVLLKPNVTGPECIATDSDKDQRALQDTLELARSMQEMRLRKKKRQTIHPVPGSIYTSKTSGIPRTRLRDAVGGRCPGQYTKEELYLLGLNPKVLNITSENAESFRFDCFDFFKREHFMESGALQLADGGWLVPDIKASVGKEEFYRALCDTPGVDPRLISEAWVSNHYRWIVWKRASMERTFPDTMGGLCLTPEQVLLQLKFRYDVEVDRSQRSALRRIMERDDTPAKTLVLCICGVVKMCQHVEATEKDANIEMESSVIWLTDGWYSIKGLLDPPLSNLLKNATLRIGDKIVTSGAELVGSQEACAPLEAPESLMLKISTNSTRRARWDTKLGYYRDSRPIKLQLSSLCSSGGLVGCVHITVLRCYPTQWMEKMPNGIYVFRNQRAEDREDEKHSMSKRRSTDLLISKIQPQIEKEMEDKKKRKGRRRKYSRLEIEALQDGEELYAAMEKDHTIETQLNKIQMEAVSTYKCCLEERRQAELQEQCVRFGNLQNPDYSSPCEEVDIVGCVVSIVRNEDHCPVIHLVDENFDLVSVRTYGSLEQLAVEELIKPRALVALSNLQVRLLSVPVPSLYAGEQATFSINPKEAHLQEAMAHLKSCLQGYENFFSVAEEKVSDVVHSRVTGSFQSPRTPGVQAKAKANDLVTPQQNFRNFPNFTPIRNKTPVSVSNRHKSPAKSLKRRRGLNYRTYIPSPSAATPLKPRASTSINQTFNPPRRSVSPRLPEKQTIQVLGAAAAEETFVHDEELAMIDTQALVEGLGICGGNEPDGLLTC
ncbi:hypothetical protein DNTS_003782, partial [Danionella cerebrum]